MNVGIVPMSAKPFHVGHMWLIEQAARENDRVIVFASLTDRSRKGEITITGSAMKRVWKEHIESTLPNNVTVVYTHSDSPVVNTYRILGDANSNMSDDVYTVYAGTDDTANYYPEAKREKYFGDIYALGRVKFAAENSPGKYNRSVSGMDASGTKVRQAIAQEDRSAFKRLMSPGLDADEILRILKSESCLRRFFVSHRS